MRIFLFLFLLSIFLVPAQSQRVTWQTRDGVVNFLSDAPLEMIAASSNELRGILDTEGNIFAFAVNVNSFQGFNSPLQRQHFNENYLESSLYPQTSFKGRIIEQVDFSKDGAYTIRAKGILNVHGVEQERIIKSQLVVDGSSIKITSNFSVRLDEHHITIPRIVNQKIAEVIQVEVAAVLIKKE
ncbi:YceI family protein [Lewinella sp. LCG006]|uniref:YceI family protein n=1 Tax=Lewinella sp. LCG006 TaxID=3231911 RepID=UPI00345F341C